MHVLSADIISLSELQDEEAKAEELELSAASARSVAYMEHYAASRRSAEIEASIGAEERSEERARKELDSVAARLKSLRDEKDKLGPELVRLSASKETTRTASDETEKKARALRERTAT